MGGNYIWRPEEHAWTRESHVANLMRSEGMDSFSEFRQKSADDIRWFWETALKDMDLSWSRPYDELFINQAGFPWTKWFLGGGINITHNCIDRHVASGHGDDIALIYEPDSGCDDAQKISFVELQQLVNQCAGAMRAAGVEQGDAIGLYAPMSVPTVAVMFACFKLGARFVPIFCGFGAQAVIDRLECCGAKLLFVNETLRRRGKEIPTSDTIAAVQPKVLSLRQVITLDDAEWDHFIAQGEPVLNAVDTDAEAHCMIIYTSGTTGKPKGTQHTHAGVLAQTGKELRYSFDVRPQEPFFWVTDIGWMMGPWELIGCLLYRTPVVMLDGAPDYPHKDRLWEIIERHKVVSLGVSPTAVRLLKSFDDVKGPEGYDLSSLKVMGSTGEPWDESAYMWAFEKIGGSRVPIMNISGGTEIMGCHLQPYPLTALKPMSLGIGALGMDVQVFDKKGLPVTEEVGDLVCCKPAPSMTKSFLGDDKRYLDTYFDKFGRNCWHHGDWASIDADGQWFLHGRADDTIKVAGKRVGPAEVEDVLMSHENVTQAAVIGAHDELKGQAIVGFVVGPTVIDEAELCGLVAEQMGKPLKPRRVYQVRDLPKTRSGKIMRGTIARLFAGDDPGDLGSMENPAAIELIKELVK